MAQYKVPQDVEADDKLIGPFSFRQFIYLLIVAALIALAWALAQIFPLLAIIPVPPAIFLLILALPLRKDQPMETYIAALIKFYTTPNKRFWNPGQRESTIVITAPKIVEEHLTKNISEEEAGRRLSFLANVVDSEGYSIKGSLPESNSPIQSEVLAESSSAVDIFETTASNSFSQNLSSEADRRHAELVANMRAALNPEAPSENPSSAPEISRNFSPNGLSSEPPSKTVSSSFSTFSAPNPASVATPPVPKTPPVVNETLFNLAKNDDLTIATIAKEANRKQKKAKPENTDEEIYISLH